VKDLTGENLLFHGASAVSGRYQLYCYHYGRIYRRQRAVKMLSASNLGQGFANGYVYTKFTAGRGFPKGNGNAHAQWPPKTAEPCSFKTEASSAGMGEKASMARISGSSCGAESRYHFLSTAR
jgi:hypothetical protein